MVLCIQVADGAIALGITRPAVAGAKVKPSCKGGFTQTVDRQKSLLVDDAADRLEVFDVEPANDSIEIDVAIRIETIGLHDVVKHGLLRPFYLSQVSGVMKDVETIKFVKMGTGMIDEEPGDRMADRDRHGVFHRPSSLIRQVRKVFRYAL